MNENYKIDILKNTPNQSKEARIGKYIYMYGFLFVGIYYIIYTVSISRNWSNYPLGLVALIFSAKSYLQINGLWIYKRYFSINIDSIRWQKNIFDRANLRWSAIIQISFKNSSIDFKLATNKIKSFSLAHITALQIDELKELISRRSHESGIKYIAE